MALAADPRRRIGPAQGDVLIDGDIIADLGGFADHGEAMVDKEIGADLGARMNVDRGQEAGDVVDSARQEIQLTAIKPVAEAMEGERPDTRVQQGFPARARRRVPAFYRIQIGDKSGFHACSILCNHRTI